MIQARGQAPPTSDRILPEESCPERIACGPEGAGAGHHPLLSQIKLPYSRRFQAAVSHLKRLPRPGTSLPGLQPEDRTRAPYNLSTLEDVPVIAHSFRDPHAPDYRQFATVLSLPDGPTSGPGSASERPEPTIRSKSGEAIRVVTTAMVTNVAKSPSEMMPR